MPARITPHLMKLAAPGAIRDLQGWLIWRFEQPGGSGKPRKVPYYAGGGRRSGQNGRPEDLAQLVTFEAARAAAARRGFDGVGFAPQRGWGICALDFDNCVQGGKVAPEVLDLVAGTYAEYSPSGNGVRAFVLGDLGNEKSIAAGDGWGFETFSTSGYVTFTGNVLPDCLRFDAQDTVAPALPGVQRLCRARFRAPEPERPDSPPMGVRPQLIAEALEVLPGDLAYYDWLMVGMAIHHETGGEGFELWDQWSARSPKYSTAEFGLARWESFGRREGPGVTIRSLVHLANKHGARISLSAAVDAAAFDDLTEHDAAASVTVGNGAAPLRFALVRVTEFVAAPPMRYWIKGVIPQAPLTVIYGESGSGKTFAVLDMVLAIARGEAWRGLRTRRGRVVYIAAEGAGGLRKRIRAYADFHGLELDAITMLLLPDAPNFLLAQDVKDVIVSIRASGGADVVVVDTFAQVTPGGNENSGEDVGRALEHCRQITKHAGASVLLVHHAGKDTSKGARGWSGLRAAADAEVEVVRDGDARQLRLSKAKDDVDGTTWGFTLNQVSVGQDEDGEPLTSCVVEPAEGIAPKAKAKKVGDVQRTVCRVLEDLIQLGNEVHYDDLVAAVVAQLPAGEGRDRRAYTVKRALQTLIDEGQVVSEMMRVRFAP